MGTIPLAIVIVGLSVITTLVGQTIVRRRVKRELLSAHTDVAGFIYAALAVIYAVVLAQVVVAAWDDFQGAREAVELEAGSILNLMRLAEDWPTDDRAAVEQALLAYVRSAIDEEWPAMARDEAPSPATIARMGDVWRVYGVVERGPVGMTQRFGASLDELSRFDLARGKRLLASHDQLPAIMWVTLILGGVLTIGFAYLFAVENRLIQSLMLTSLAALIALLLLLAEELDAPFRGDNRVGPDALVQVVERSAGL